MPSMDRPWWQRHRSELLHLMQDQPAGARGPRYVYHLETVLQAADRLLGLKPVDQIYFALKANCNRSIVQSLHRRGIGLECVSSAELQLASKLTDQNAKLLFTPNFAAKEEYELAYELGATVTVDNLFPLQEWPEVFRQRSLFLRIDPGQGAGHHKHVHTAGPESKFGLAPGELAEVSALCDQLEMEVLGLHTHVGSGIHDPTIWRTNAQVLENYSHQFPTVRVHNLGGGLGIADRNHPQGLDLQQLARELVAVKESQPEIRYWLEPGRYFVAEAGVLLARVTQCKQKGPTRFVGIETGMNSLLRPALYQAHHDIVNLTRLDAPLMQEVSIVGPICESADVFGQQRPFPEARPGDVVLIAQAGAYGQTMSSRYNLREPAAEVVFQSQTAGRSTS